MEFLDNTDTQISHKKSQYKIGTIVSIISTGGIYEYYHTAFYTMHGDIFHFANAKTTNAFHLGYNRNVRGILYKSKWVIVGKCLHSRGDDILYLIYQPNIRYGLMIGEDYIKFEQSGYPVNESDLRFYIAK